MFVVSRFSPVKFDASAGRLPGLHGHAADSLIIDPDELVFALGGLGVAETVGAFRRRKDQVRASGS
jgi:hypothetical protein